MGSIRKTDITSIIIDDNITVYPLLEGKNSCRAGTAELYNEDPYTPPIQDMQKGVYIISGCGTAFVGDESFHITKGHAYMIPASTKHSITKSRRCKKLEVFWFHARE